ncbi:MAG: phosphoribosylformylglycinamidine cyclo-ligase [Actinomycetota bacterium]|nr:phosphoribosylformylglycinamidine cyclo-ligase [Actinomycetota bacterium]
MPEASGGTYREAGVDLDAAEEAVGRIRPHAARTARPEVVAGVGGFAGLFALDPARWREPVLVTAADGVGTKLEMARRVGRHRPVGVDLVAMVVDDLVVSGAEPLVFLDYLAVGRLDPDHVEQVVAGVADGCEQAGCALVGGETAEHPGVLPVGGYDLAGFGVGVVERERLLGPHRVRRGDALVAMASSGLHANGFSLVRRVVGELDLAAVHPALDGPLGEALLRPTRIYAPDCLALDRAVRLHALCHVTGGGIRGNLPRVMPEGLGAVVDAATFPRPAPVFAFLRRHVAEDEMWRVFNMGAGMLAVAPDGPAAVDVLRERGVEAWVCGAVDEGPGVRLAGVGAGGASPAAARSPANG